MKQITSNADVVIIGSGPIGASCARNLAEQGLTVLILEAGAVCTSPPGSHFRNQERYQRDPDSFFEEVSKWCKQYDAKANPLQLPGANITNAYGGQGLLWTNNCPRPPKHEMLNCYNSTEWNALYDKAEQYLSVSTHLFDQSIRQEKIINHLTPYLEQQQRGIAKVPLAAQRVDERRIHFTALDTILDVPSPIRERITIQCNTRVLRLNRKNDFIDSLDLLENNTHQTIQFKTLIIAGGAFDTTQLLYDSQIRSSALGHYLHFHPLIMAQLVLNESLRSSKANDPLVRTCIYPTLNYPWHTMILRDIFPKSTEEQIDNSLLMDMQVFIPIEVREENQMILSDKKPKFTVQFTAKDKINLQKAQQDVLGIAAQLGRFIKGGEPRFFDYGFTHPMGMCRLGEDPRTSVANHYGQVHGFNNLYLATVGLIPSFMAVNPTLTSVALGLGTTRYIVQKGG